MLATIPPGGMDEERGPPGLNGDVGDNIGDLEDVRGGGGGGSLCGSPPLKLLRGEDLADPPEE